MSWKRFRAFLGAIGLVCACAGGAAAQSTGRMVFLNPLTGDNVVGGVDEYGTWHTEAIGNEPSLVGEYSLTATAAGVLAYDPVDGGGTIIHVDGRALPGFFRSINLSGNWQMVTGLDNFVFLYDTVKTGVLLQLNPDGSTTQQTTLTNLSPWTSITATDNYFFFYNAPNGAAVVATVSNIEAFTQTFSNVIASGYTLVGSVGDFVVPYNATTGWYEVDALIYDGSLSDYISSNQSFGTMPAGFKVVAKLNEYLAWYNPLNGTMLIGYIDRTPGNIGKWTKTQQLNVNAGWTHILGLGNYLAFYNANNGALVTGTINHAGQYVRIGWAQVKAKGFGLPNVVVTRR